MKLFCFADTCQPPRKSRRSLDFDTPSTSKTIEKPCSDNLNDIQSVSYVDNTVLNSQTDESATATNSNSKKRTVEELFGDIDDIGDDVTFDDQPNVKKQKSNEHDEDLALIEHILELRKLLKEKTCVTSLNKDYSTSSLERDKRNLSYSVPKYPFITITRPDKERIYVRFHSEDYEKEDCERIVEECSFSGVMGDSFKDVWTEARNLVSLLKFILLELKHKLNKFLDK